MLENLRNFFKRMGKKEDEELLPSSSDAAKERLHLVLMQDRVNVSVDFLDMMKQEIIEVTKRYIDVDEKEIDVRLTNQINEDGSNGMPALYANIPIVGIKAEKTIELNQNDSEKNSNIVINKEEIKISNNKNAQKETKNSNINKSEKSSETAKNTTMTIKSSNTMTDEDLKVKKTKEKKVDKTDDVEETNIKKVASATTKKRTTTKKETISE